MAPLSKPTLALALVLAAVASARPMTRTGGLAKRDLRLSDEGILLLDRSGAGRRRGPARGASGLAKRADILDGVLNSPSDTSTATVATTSATTTTTTAAAAVTTTSAAAASSPTETTTTTAPTTTSSPAASASTAPTTTTQPSSSSSPTGTSGTPTATSATPSATVVTTSSMVTFSITNSDGSVSTGTSASVGTATQTAAASNKSSSSSSTGKTWGIVGGVAGGVVALAAIVFIAYKCSQRRFSSLDDDDANIKWPELQRDGETLNPSATHRTGGAGIEMGERRGSDEWDAQEPFFPPQHDGRMSPGPGMGYAGDGGHHYNPAAPYDNPYAGNVYPPQAAGPGTYYDPYQNSSFADSRGNYIGGASPVPAYAMAGGGEYADEKEEEDQQAHQRRESRTLSQMELASPEGVRVGLPPSRGDTFDGQLR